MDVPATQITRVALRIGPMHGRVRVTAGDRNLRLLVPRSDAYKLATALTGVGSITRPSPNLPGPVLMVRRVFDHVLADTPMTVTAARALPLQVSDHCALVVDLAHW